MMKAIACLLIMMSGPALAQSMEDFLLSPSIEPDNAPLVRPRTPEVTKPEIVKPVVKKPTIEQLEMAMPTPVAKPEITAPQSAVTIAKPTPAPSPSPAIEPSEPTPQPVNDGDVMILPLPENMAGQTLPPDMTQWLDETIIAPLQSSDQFLLMTAYAAPTSIQEVSGRRIALSHGLLVREYLLSKGIDPIRTTLKAVNASDNTPEGLPQNRIEFYLQDEPAS